MNQIPTNTSLLPIWIPPQRVFPPKAGGERAFLEGVHDGVGGACARAERAKDGGREVGPKGRAGHSERVEGARDEDEARRPW